MAFRFSMAEKEGFEPSRPIKDLRAFQARPFNHLGISPALVIITTVSVIVITINEAKPSISYNRNIR